MGNIKIIRGVFVKDVIVWCIGVVLVVILVRLLMLGRLTLQELEALFMT